MWMRQSQSTDDKESLQEILIEYRRRSAKMMFDSYKKREQIQQDWEITEIAMSKK